MRYAMIMHEFDAFKEARRILAANFTTVAERKAALAVRDDFMASSGNYVGELLDGLQELRDYTDGEECADPESCGEARGSLPWLCSRCRLREAIPELALRPTARAGG